MRLAFLLFLEHEEIDWIVLRLCQFKGLHYLKTSFPESRTATFRDVAVLALELTGLIWRGIVTGIRVERFATVKRGFDENLYYPEAATRYKKISMVDPYQT